MDITPDTSLHELLRAHPDLVDVLAHLNPRFALLRNPVARATLARAATLRRVAEIGGMTLDELMRAIASAIGSPAPTGGEDRERRLRAMRDIIRSLHNGADPSTVRARFVAELGDATAEEIAAMEQQLIDEGLPVAEIQRLCDVHVGAFRDALDRHAPAAAPPGHPIHTMTAENRHIERLANELGEVARLATDPSAADAFDTRARAAAEAFPRIDLHYQRKEHQWFPVLERHGITGPSQVMWGVHDEIRAALKTLRSALERGDRAAWAARAPAAARALAEMVYKEEKILFPMAQATLSDAEWAEVRRGEDVLGYGWEPPAATWPAEVNSCPPSTSGAAAGAAGAEPRIPLDVGQLTCEQINLILRHLPVEISFVDEHDEVRYYSDTPHRIFPRSPGVIGRKVQNCHPPKSLALVQEILDEFRANRRDLAEFWMQNREGRFIHIRYFALRDAAGAYRGCVEVTQDVTDIRRLEGERRLLQWDGGPTSASPAG